VQALWDLDTERTPGVAEIHGPGRPGIVLTVGESRSRPLLATHSRACCIGAGSSGGGTPQGAEVSSVTPRERRTSPSSSSRSSPTRFASPHVASRS
jgi:hypothetical protein